MYFSTDSRHSYGQQLCSASSRLVPLFVLSRGYEGGSSQNRNEGNTFPWY